MSDASVSRRSFLAALPALSVAVAWRRGRSQELPVPEWMQVDREGRTVRLEVVAGKTEENNRWNLNGYTNGEADIVVPRGFEVRITFRNDDPDLAHSLGIDERQDPWPAMFQDPTPAFEGAITSNPTSTTDATAPGGSEELTFTASSAGEYAMVCYIPGHALTGMWTNFVVSADGTAGVRERG